MKVLRVVPLDGEWTCIMDDNTGISVDRINGTPKQGDEINENFEIVQEIK